ncbi:SOLUTE CARRIER FAMILY 17 [Salix purpurea]|uniref:SOLUTE CARRIER FAMILY 17 n=1 Tax=Salix purpurea TaxID=77065 RepID=A0A9Q0UKW2_SALPP|nr:SOLUTE CARRIER FAMILY 17 [Salix purpurea]
MANLTLKSKSFCSLSHNTNTQTSVFKTTTSFKNNSLPFLHSGNSLKFRVWCGIKEKENVKESESVPDELTGLKRADKLEPKRGSSLDFEQGFGNDSGSSEVGFYRKWPPWKNIPQRYKLIGSTSLAFVICNMDKVNLSIAIIPYVSPIWMECINGWVSAIILLLGVCFEPITRRLALPRFLVGVQDFTVSYLTSSPIHSLTLVKKVLQIGVLTWSVATALLPLLAGYMPGFVLSRVLVGIGEGVSPSAATDLIARSIPLEERSRAVAFVFGGLSVGSVTGLLLAPPLIQNFGWASVFFIFGFLGIAWFLGFRYLEEGQASFSAIPTSRSHSIYSEKSSSNALAELGSSLKDVPWKAFFQTPAVWAMIYAHFCGSWGHYTCLSWLPSYFSEELSLNLTEAAWVSILPPLASVFRDQHCCTAC